MPEKAPKSGLLEAIFPAMYCIGKEMNCVKNKYMKIFQYRRPNIFYLVYYNHVGRKNSLNFLHLVYDTCLQFTVNKTCNGKRFALLKISIFNNIHVTK